MAKTFKEVIAIAKEQINAQNLEKYEPSSGAVRPTTSSSPRMRAFAELVVKLCEENGIETPKHMSEEEFASQFSDENLTQRLGSYKRPEEKKQKLMHFLDDISPESHYETTMAEMFARSQEFSAEDKKFLYDAYVVTAIAEHEQKKGMASTYKEHSKNELALHAKRFLENQVKKESDKIHQPIPTKPENDKSRDIAVVIGAPGSGKSTFINSKIAEGYIHIDLDEIAIGLAQDRNVSIDDFGSEIYREASVVAKLASALALKRGYNIFIEKIGVTKEQVYNFTDEYKKIAKKCGTKPTSRLYCAHVSKESSTVRASGRTMEQLFDGEPLRYYRETEVYDKDNASLYTYADILKDQLSGEREEFEEMEIRIREGLSPEDEKLRSMRFDDAEKERYKSAHRQIVDVPKRAHITPQPAMAVAAQRAF